jgi:type II secretory pathway component PulF
MPDYVISAYTADGHRITRTKPFDREADIDAYGLRERLTIVEKTLASTPYRRQKIRYTAEKADFYRELALYIEKGVPAVDRTKDLQMLAERDTQWARVSLSFLKSYETMDIGPAMAEQPNAFAAFESNLFANLPGDEIPKTLRQLSDYYERTTNAGIRIRKAMIVPALNFGALMGLIAIYLFSVVPAMREMDDPKAANHLPPVFVLLGAVHDWIVNPWNIPWLVAGVVVSIFGWIGLMRIPSVARQYDLCLVRFKLLKVYAIERRLFALSTIKLMFEAGHQREALAVARDSAIGPIFFEELDRAYQISINKIPAPDGRPYTRWADALNYAKNVFPRRIRTLLYIAEQYSEIPDELGGLCARLTDELNRELENLPMQVTAFSSAATFVAIGAIIFFIILPFSGYVANFGL